MDYRKRPLFRPVDNEQGIVGWWPFADGTATDISGNQNHGVKTGNPVFTPSPVGNAFAFSLGNYFLVSTPKLANPISTNRVSVACWVNPTTSFASRSDLITVFLNGGTGTDQFVLGHDVTAGGKLEMFINQAGSVFSSGTGSLNIVNGIWYHTVGTFDGTNIAIYVNGKLEATAVHAGTMGSGVSNPIQIGGTGGSAFACSSALADVRLYNRALSASEINALYYRGITRLNLSPDEWETPAFRGAAAITGTLGVTETTDIAAFAADAKISAALAVTDTKDVAAFAGDAKISAALAVTEATDTALFAGDAKISAALTTTEAADAASFGGTVTSPAITGTLATTEATDVTSFAGDVKISAALAVTEATDTANFAAGAAHLATLAITEAKDAANFNGSFIATGTLATTEAKDVLSFNGSSTFGITGTFALVDTRDSASFGGTIVNATTGVLAANEARIDLSNNVFQENSAVNTVVGALAVVGIDTASINATLTGVAGTLAVTEAQDQALFLTSSLGAILATLAANEAGILLSNNVFSENAATNTVVGSLAVLGLDAAAFNGFVGVSGTLASSETADAAAFAGALTPLATAVLAVTESPDQVAFSVAVFFAITGTLTVTETQDSASLSGALFSPPAGQFAVFEAPDTAIFSGSVTGIPGQLSATETPDIAAFTGTIGVLAQLAVIEASDLANFIGSATQLAAVGDLIVVERLDIALFTGPEADESDFANWQFGQRFDRSLTSRFPWQAGLH